MVVRWIRGCWCTPMRKMAVTWIGVLGALETQDGSKTNSQDDLNLCCSSKVEEFCVAKSTNTGWSPVSGNRNTYLRVLPMLGTEELRFQTSWVDIEDES